MTAWFVTATGTDIGKTFITAGLLRAARAAGRPATAIKPVMSGYTTEAAAHSDAGMLLAAMGRAPSPADIAAIAPWRFAAPLSPDMAAAREGRGLDLAAITRFCAEAIALAPGLLLIEGVGGAMVPLNATHTVRDWIAALNLPVLLVTGTYLGSISHTLATLEALRGAEVAIILNESEAAPVPPAETAATLQRFTASPIHIVPRDPAPGVFEDLVKQL